MRCQVCGGESTTAGCRCQSENLYKITIPSPPGGWPLTPMSPPQPAFVLPPNWAGMITLIPLRDWFAGQALAGLVANTENGAAASETVRYAYLFADAMLAERAKVNP
jgi:hypothetical protein